VVLGAFVFTVLPEVLRSVVLASFFFYGLSLAGLWAILKAKRFAMVMGVTILAGLVLKLLVRLIFPVFDSGILQSGAWLNRLVQSWLIIPENFKLAGNIVTIVAIFALLAAILLKHKPLVFNGLIGITFYMFSFAWETRLVLEPSATRILIVGVSLVVLMILRPQGILGQKEVRVV
jgi:hypothetical protein